MSPDAGVALVLADGAVASRARLDAAWPGWDAGVDLVVAADGGARHARTLGLEIDRWVGDGDSISPADLAALDAGGTLVRRVAEAKDETDTELAVLDALEVGSVSVILLGGLGGPRLDHALANLLLLAHPALDGLPLTLYDEAGARISLLTATNGPVRRELPGSVGDLVSLLPLAGEATGVTTTGLAYPLVDEPLPLGPARGISNVRTEPVASVSLRSGRLLVIETPASLRP